jgi:hypothetical protein
MRADHIKRDDKTPSEQQSQGIVHQGRFLMFVKKHNRILVADSNTNFAKVLCGR